MPVVMFPGGLQWHQGLDIAIRAFGKLRVRMPQAEFHIYGDGNMKPQLIAYFVANAYLLLSALSSAKRTITSSQRKFSIGMIFWTQAP